MRPVARSTAVTTTGSPGAAERSAIVSHSDRE
jgi:hypothetical protein